MSVSVITDGVVGELKQLGLASGHGPNHKRHHDRLLGAGRDAKSSWALDLLQPRDVSHLRFLVCSVDIAQSMKNTHRS